MSYFRWQKGHIYEATEPPGNVIEEGDAGDETDKVPGQLQYQGHPVNGAGDNGFGTGIGIPEIINVWLAYLIQGMLSRLPLECEDIPRSGFARFRFGVE